jgi:exodeoxyribonuclease VII small subunit
LTSTKKEKYSDFESALARLQEITDLLESGEAGLEDALSLYSEGVEIAAFCSGKLSQAEKKVSILREKNKKLIEENFDEPIEGGND